MATEIPDLLESFNIGGKRFGLDLVATIDEWDAVKKECDAKGATHSEYLKELANRLKADHEVSLSPSQMDWLRDHLAVLYAKKKAEVAHVISAMWKSPPVTASTPTS